MAEAYSQNMQQHQLYILQFLANTFVSIAQEMYNIKKFCCTIAITDTVILIATTNTAVATANK